MACVTADEIEIRDVDLRYERCRLRDVRQERALLSDIAQRGIDRPLAGANLQAHLEALRKQMMDAAENLEFEEAARLRDEVKRLEAVDLAISEDPLARQSAIRAAQDDAERSRSRSSAGKPGTRSYRGKSRPKR